MFLGSITFLGDRLSNQVMVDGPLSERHPGTNITPMTYAHSCQALSASIQTMHVRDESKFFFAWYSTLSSLFNDVLCVCRPWRGHPLREVVRRKWSLKMGSHHARENGFVFGHPGWMTTATLTCTRRPDAIEIVVYEVICLVGPIWGSFRESTNDRPPRKKNICRVRKRNKFDGDLGI